MSLEFYQDLFAERIGGKEFGLKTELYKFAKEHHIMVVHDAAYAAVPFDGYKSYSIFSVDGAMDDAGACFRFSVTFEGTEFATLFPFVFTFQLQVL